MKVRKGGNARSSVIALRWLGRVWGVAATLMVLAFVFGGREHLRFNAWTALGFALFPVGIVLGFALAWWRDGIGALVTLASLLVFHLWLSINMGRPIIGTYFVLFAFPGFIHAAAWMIDRRARRVERNPCADLTR